jgi:hypothetical protein
MICMIPKTILSGGKHNLALVNYSAPVDVYCILGWNADLPAFPRPQFPTADQDTTTADHEFVRIGRTGHIGADESFTYFVPGYSFARATFARTKA